MVPPLHGWSRKSDSNRRPTHYECVALPTELFRRRINNREDLGGFFNLKKLLPAPIKHPFEGEVGFFADGFGDEDLGGVVAEAIAEFFKGIHLHVAAVIAGATVGRAGAVVTAGDLFGGGGDEGFFRNLALEAVEHAGLGRDNDFVTGVFAGEADHALGTANVVGKVADDLGALGVGDNGGTGKLFANAVDGLFGEEDVDVATARPVTHLATGLLGDPASEVLVGNEENFTILGNALNDPGGISARADDVGEGFDPGGAVDVGDNVCVRVFVPPGFESFRRATVGERAARFFVGEEDFAGRVDDFGGLGHEVDAAEDDSLGIGLGGFVSEAEGIADVIGKALDRFDLVVMGEDDGIALALECKDLLDQVGIGGGAVAGAKDEGIEGRLSRDRHDGLAGVGRTGGLQEIRCEWPRRKRMRRPP